VAQALDSLNLAVFATDASGQLLLANRPAQQILKLRDGLQLTSCGTLETSRLAARSSLLEWISNAGLFPEPGISAWTNPILVLKRPMERQPLTVAVKCARAGANADAGAASALIFAIDPERELGAVEADLRQLHGLTAREARLANLLMQGNTIEECCEDLSIQTSTVRMHLGSLFAKTGVQRQGQLVSLLLNSVGVLRSTAAESLPDGHVSGFAHSLNKTLGAVEAGREALECLDVGVAVLDDSLQLRFASPLSLRLLAECDGMAPDGAELLSMPAGFRSLRGDSLLPQRRRNVHTKQLAWHAFALAPRKSGQRPVTVMARKVTPCAPGDARAAYLLFLLNPERPMRVAEEGLRQLYGFTRAESRLANLLMEGHCLDTCCAQLQIRASTARMHLSNLFAKAGVQRQGQLIALLMRTLGMLPAPDPIDRHQSEERSNSDSEASWLAPMSVRARAEGGI
jgi:DNA-binding CsgD family transcriptional regulator